MDESRAGRNEDRLEHEQKQADRHWEPLLKKWKSWLLDKSRRAEAEDLLATVTDRRDLPSILRVFPADGSEAGQNRRVRLLGQVDHPSSSRALAAQAIRTPFDSVRNAAVQILKGRPPRDYAAELVEMVQGTIRYEVKPVSGPNSRGALAIDAPRFRMLRTYDVPHAFELHPSFRGYVGYDANGLPIAVSGRELDSMRRVCREPSSRRGQARGDRITHSEPPGHGDRNRRRQMAADIYTIEATNQQVRDENASIIPVLKAAARGAIEPWRR